jgi:hypothetical protein
MAECPEGQPGSIRLRVRLHREHTYHLYRTSLSDCMEKDFVLHKYMTSVLCKLQEKRFYSGTIQFLICYQTIMLVCVLLFISIYLRCHRDSPLHIFTTISRKKHDW